MSIDNAQALDVGIDQTLCHLLTMDWANDSTRAGIASIIQLQSSAADDIILAIVMDEPSVLLYISHAPGGRQDSVHMFHRVRKYMHLPLGHYLYVDKLEPCATAEYAMPIARIVLHLLDKHGVDEVLSFWKGMDIPMKVALGKLVQRVQANHQQPNILPVV
jgi:hypothetical protein